MNSNSRQQRGKSSYMASKRFVTPKQQHHSNDSTTKGDQKQPYTKLNGFAAPKHQTQSTDSSSSSFSNPKPSSARRAPGTKKSCPRRPKPPRQPSKPSQKSSSSSNTGSSSKMNGNSKDGGGVMPMDWSPRKDGPYYSARFLPIARAN